jgi:glycosyltransferase involved in cell wall biosynthesis
LVQGIPFDVIPRTVETLSALPHRPRIVTLPHFHGDDRFYHWKRYYESFAAADLTLLFSSSIAAHFEGLCATTVVPGGGVRSEEHGDTVAQQRFKEVHRSDRPFFLVLGRKTASKGYEEILTAHRALRRFGSNAELVLIGPDEDGRSIDAPGVYYLGRQSREVIRGALSGCLALVTMSRTESFGIAVCEAWLFGKPVIANKACYSFRELIEDGTTGLLVDSDADLIWAMRHLEVRADERRRMGKAGFSQVTAKFSWERVAEACAGAVIGTSK